MEHFFIDHPISSKFAQRWHLVYNFFCKKCFILSSFDNTANAKIQFFLGHPIYTSFLFRVTCSWIGHASHDFQSRTVLAKVMENLSFFCQFFLFFLHLLSPQLLGTHFFIFLANFFINVGLYHWIFFIKMACSIQIYA